MQIILNGISHNIDKRLTLYDLVVELNCNLDGVAIAINQSIIPRSKYLVTWLNDNDRVEIVTAFQGG